MSDNAQSDTNQEHFALAFGWGIAGESRGNRRKVCRITMNVTNRVIPQAAALHLWMTTSSARSQAKAESNPVATSRMIRNAQRKLVEKEASKLAVIGNPVNSPVATAKVSNEPLKKVGATDIRVETSRTIPNVLAKRAARVDKAERLTL
ncbi:hypothetical protein J2X72_004741 [Phyllobacterium sp. 1468]|nr:hypothetical protein [Phyllobacterium sp. 1468]